MATSTAELKPQVYTFQGKRLKIAFDPKVCGYNYYLEFGIENLNKALAYLHSPIDVAELACGKGVYLTALSQLYSVKRLLGVDVNPKAIVLTRKNVGKKATLLQEDFQDTLTRIWKADLITFDAPLIPLPPEAKLSKATKLMIDGGPNGRRYINQILYQIDSHLRFNGGVYFVQSSFVGLSETLRILASRQLSPYVIAEKKYYLKDTITTRKYKKWIEQFYTFPVDKQGEFFQLQAILGIKK